MKKESMSSQREMRLTLQSLGIDVDALHWQDLATCSSVEIDLLSGSDDIFFDRYEKEDKVARATDEMCLRCPVTAECFFYGQEEELTGVWGGFYLTKGQVDSSRNKHKTKETVHRLSERIFADE
jgi:hypothetical protein